MKTLFYMLAIFFFTENVAGQPIVFSCSGTEDFGYYISSATFSGTTTLTYSSSRLSRIATVSGARTELCSSSSLGISMNALAFNPNDNFLYAVSRYDATQFSGKMYRIGSNCQTLEIPVTGAIQKFTTNLVSTVDGAGGNISSGTFDLDNNYYVNTSFTNSSSSGFTNKIQKIKLTGSTASLVSSTTIKQCSGCTGKVQITDIIFDDATGKLIGRNKQNDRLYSINPTTGNLTAIGTGTGIGTSPSILGIYKDLNGNVRAIDESGKVYPVNTTTGVFGAAFATVTPSLNSGNADAASGCFAPPISGHLYIDANGLEDGTVNGTFTNVAGTTVMYANLIGSNGKVLLSTPISSGGYYQFLGMFNGTYEVQISATAGIPGSNPPAQGLPSTYSFVGDHIGLSPGSDGTPNGKISFSVTSGVIVTNVNFGIDAYPVANDVTEPAQSNPGGTVQVIVPTLPVTDTEDGIPTKIRIVQPPNTTTEGTLYYNGNPVSMNQIITNYNSSLLRFDPIDGTVTMSFTYNALDAANLISNLAMVTMSFTTVVPVTLVEFSGKYLDDRVYLKWSTQSETNSDYFMVQKSENRADFSDVGKVTAAGNTNQMSYYEYSDHSVTSAIYYRLKQLDLDGSHYYSDIIKITTNGNLDFNIFPTAARDKLTITYTQNRDEILKLRLINTQGHILHSENIMGGNAEIEIDNLPSGMYTIVVFQKSGHILGTKRIIKL